MDEHVPEHMLLRFRDPGRLLEFCCAQHHNSACWTKQPEFEVDHKGAPPGVVDVLEQYVSCCFPTLSARAALPAPDWMNKKLAADFGRWMELGRFDPRGWNESVLMSVPENDRKDLCLFKIDSGIITHCDVEDAGIFTQLLRAVLRAIIILRRHIVLPDLQFYVVAAESLKVALPFPAFCMANEAEGNGVLMPWWMYLTSWTRQWSQAVMEHSNLNPWEGRDDRLYWRGSDTGCHYGDALHKSKRGSLLGCETWGVENWHRFQRPRLVILSSLAPAFVDAKFTYQPVHDVLNDTLWSSGHMVPELVPPHWSLTYKYLAYVDGTSHSDRLFWMLHSHSAALIVESQLDIWISDVLKPYEHMIPLKADLSNAVEMVLWMRANDAKVREIAENARTWARLHISQEANLHYFLLGLRYFAARQQRQ
jgi:hypothetical protein